MSTCLRPNATSLEKMNPHQAFVLDHLAKPPVNENRPARWRRLIKELALRENVYCKVSGLVTEANFETWTESQLQPYFETVLEAFGAHRLMFGTDWPVCLVACPYRRWYDVVCRFGASLSQEEKTNLFGRTAARAYGLDYL